MVLDILLALGVLGVLFYALGKSADLIVLNMRQIGERLGISVFFLGLVLGFFTSLPEFSIGINALVKKAEDLSLGNLLGGVLVLFGLVLGGSLILNRKIGTEHRLKSFLPTLVYIALPFFLGLDGVISEMDGTILILLYFFILYHLYLGNKTRSPAAPAALGDGGKFLKKAFLIGAGLVLLIVISSLIVKFTLFALRSYEAPVFIVGLIVFSLGTNLPEMIVTIRSWSRHIKELSISNIIGSAMANSLIVGIVAFLGTVQVKVDFSYYFLLGTAILILAFADYAYENDLKFTRREGIVLLLLYLIFLASQLAFFFAA